VAAGTRLSDHSLDCPPARRFTDEEAVLIFERAQEGKAATPEEKEKFSFYLMVFFGQLDAAKGWTKQLHLRAFRNLNSEMAGKLGPDTIGDTPQGSSLIMYLDALACAGSMPKIVIYILNPRDNYLFACLGEPQSI
jgi:glucuronate isomerase